RRTTKMGGCPNVVTEAQVQSIEALKYRAEWCPPPLEVGYYASQKPESYKINQNSHKYTTGIKSHDPRTCPTGHRPEDQPAGHQEHALQAAQVSETITSNVRTRPRRRLCGRRVGARGGRAGAVGAELASRGGGAARSRWRSPLTAARRRRGLVAVTVRAAAGGGGAGSGRWRRGLPAVVRWRRGLPAAARAPGRRWRGELVSARTCGRVGGDK
ncbi:hypothetical protein ACJX0J_033703, partial [Zea mays]